MTIEKNLNNFAEILVVEDNPGDVKLFIESFKQITTGANFYIVTNGIEALKFLNKEDKYWNAPKPDLIVLDLNLPKKSGLEVLSEMSQDENMRDIPVVIFSFESHRKDVLDNCKNIRNHIFITKPNNLEGYTEVIKTVGKFWFSLENIS